MGHTTDIVTFSHLAYRKRQVYFPGNHRSIAFYRFTTPDYFLVLTSR